MEYNQCVKNSIRTLMGDSLKCIYPGIVKKSGLTLQESEFKAIFNQGTENYFSQDLGLSRCENNSDASLTFARFINITFLKKQVFNKKN